MTSHFRTFTIRAALGIGAISKNSQIKEDTAIGIIFAGMFALGIALISTVRSYAVDLSHFLFGDVLSVSTSSLWLILIVGVEDEHSRGALVDDDEGALAVVVRGDHPIGDPGCLS